MVEALRRGFFLFLLTCTLFNTTWSLVVKEVSINNSSEIPMILVGLDQVFSLTAERPDEETIIIDFPVGTQWEAPTSGTSSDPTKIKGYSFIPYQDGSGDLIVKVNRNLLIDQSGTAQNGIFGISFRDTDKVGTQSLAVKRFQIGPKEGMTRIVFDLNRPGKFSVSENPDGTKIFVNPLEKTEWLIAKKLSQPKIPASNVLFKGYTLTEQQPGALEIEVQPGSRLIKSFLIDTKTTTPKLVIDFSNTPPVQPEVTPPEKKCPLKLTAVGSILPKKVATVPVTTSIFPNKQVVQRFDIISQKDDTILRLVSSKKINMKITENSHTHQITLHIPKIDWSEVKVPEEKGGLIQGFQINQDDPDFTDIVLDVEKGTHIIGKNTFSGGGEFRFIMYLNENEEKTPDWLIEETVDRLSYAARDREHAEVSHIVYRGGLSPYMNIGDGLYFGLQGDAVVAENTSHANVNNTQTHTSQGLLGGGGHVFVGYGTSINRLYLGGEVSVGLFGADDKETFSSGAISSSNNIQVGKSWDVTGRLGFYASPTSLIYGRFGVVNTDFSYSGSFNANGAPIFPGSYKKNNRTGLLLGAGIESALNDTFTVRLGASQTNYQASHYKNAPNFKKDRLIVHQVNVGVGYKVSPMSGPAAADFYEESIGTGFYLGGALGTSTVLNRRTVNGTTGGTPTKYTGQSTDTEPAWSAFAGYSANMGRFYLAGEIEASANQTLAKETILTNGVVMESYTDKLSWLWALTLRPGYIFNQGTLVYGRLGAVGGQFSHTSQMGTNNRTFASGSSSKQHIYGIRTGGGIETFLSQNISLRADYVIDYMPNVTLQDKSIPGVTEKINLLNNEFKLGIAYTIDP
jgi:opacity protein-like surface antigen